MGQMLLLHSFAHPIPHLESLDFLACERARKGKDVPSERVLCSFRLHDCGGSAAQGLHLVSAGTLGTPPRRKMWEPVGALKLTDKDRRLGWFIFELEIFSLWYKNESRLITNHPSLVCHHLELEHQILVYVWRIRLSFFSFFPYHTDHAKIQGFSRMQHRREKLVGLGRTALLHPRRSS